MTDSHDLALMEQAREFQQTIRIAYAGLLDVVAEMDRSGTAKHTGYTRLSRLLVEVLNIAPGKAARMVRQAENIAENVTPTGHLMPAQLPTVRAALLAGLVDGEHIDVIAEKLAQLPTTVSVEDRELVETTLADTAQVANPLVVREHGRILVEHLHADGTEPRAEEQLAEPRNSFSYRRTRDGGMDFKGHVERECAELFENLIHAFGTPVANDTRPRAQRLGDAVADVIDAASHAAKLPTTCGEKPHLAVYLNWDVLAEGVGTATLESGTPLSASATRRLACDAEIIPIVLGSDSVPLDLGRAVRLVRPDQRKALIARDKGCAYPHCTAPASWCDAHHLTHWLNGGPTNLNNMVLLCRKHHRILHHSEWHVSINPSTGLPEFRPPKWIDPERKPLRNTLRH